jgi:hypothetical protein
LPGSRLGWSKLVGSGNGYDRSRVLGSGNALDRRKLVGNADDRSHVLDADDWSRILGSRSTLAGSRVLPSHRLGRGLGGLRRFRRCLGYRFCRRLLGRRSRLHGFSGRHVDIFGFLDADAKLRSVAEVRVRWRRATRQRREAKDRNFLQPEPIDHAFAPHE